MIATKNIIKFATVVAVVIGAILFKKYTQNDEATNKVSISNKKIFSPEELSIFDGIQQEKLYLAVIGNIYDVTDGRTHYAKGAPYHYFIGKDGTRALVTGNFKDETINKDHILDLSCSDLANIFRWRKTFKEKYIYIGILSGRFYDAYGQATTYMSELKQKMKQCKKEKQEDKIQKKNFPLCNVAWNEEDGATVWCTKASGGIVRDWVGVPRQIYLPENDETQCVCVNDDDVYNSLFQEYTGCPTTSTQCSVIDS